MNVCPVAAGDAETPWLTDAPKNKDIRFRLFNQLLQVPEPNHRDVNTASRHLPLTDGPQRVLQFGRRDHARERDMVTAPKRACAGRL